MNDDLKFSATIYGLGGGLFFLGYALFEVPSSLMLARFSAPQWIARIMITWGFLAAGMMFVHTPLQFYVMRFLLGVAEAGFFPSVIYYLAGWFPMACRGRAVSRIYVASSLASVVMGAMPVRHSLLAAFTNPRVLLLGSVGFLGNGAGNGLLLSAPAVLIAGAGLDTMQVASLVSIGGGLGVVCIFIAGWNSDRSGDRLRDAFALTVVLRPLSCFLALPRRRLWWSWGICCSPRPFSRLECSSCPRGPTCCTCASSP